MIKSQASRPKRRATRSHFFRYLQTRNPSRLEEEDLRRALEASLEDCPVDYWPDDSVNRSPSNQSNGPSSSAGSSTSGGDNIIHQGSCNLNLKSCKYDNGKRRNRRSNSNSTSCCSRCSFSHPNQLSSNGSTTTPTATMHHNHQNCSYQHCLAASNYTTANQNNNNHNQCCPFASAHRRYKPVAKKNIYDEADFFHDGIMAYIEYELMMHKAN